MSKTSRKQQSLLKTVLKKSVKMIDPKLFFFEVQILLSVLESVIKYSKKSPMCILKTKLTPFLIKYNLKPNALQINSSSELNEMIMYMRDKIIHILEMKAAEHLDVISAKNVLREFLSSLDSEDSSGSSGSVTPPQTTVLSECLESSPLKSDVSSNSK